MNRFVLYFQYSQQKENASERVTSIAPFIRSRDFVRPMLLTFSLTKKEDTSLKGYADAYLKAKGFKT